MKIPMSKPIELACYELCIPDSGHRAGTRRNYFFISGYLEYALLICWFHAWVVQEPYLRTANSA
jgi:flagellar biogenesis protein FliO